MKLIRLECTSCGNPLRISPNEETTICLYCGSAYEIRRENNRYKLFHTNEWGRVFGGGANRPVHDKTGKSVTKMKHHNFLAWFLIAVLLLMFAIMRALHSQPNNKETDQGKPVSSAENVQETAVPKEKEPEIKSEETPVPSAVPESEKSAEIKNTSITTLISIADGPRDTSRLKDNYGNSYGSAVINNHGYNGSAGPITYEYLINSGYHYIKGTLYIPEGETSNGTSTLTIRGDGRTIYTSPALDKRSAPVPVEVNISGINDLEIVWSNNSGYSNISSLNCCLAEACFVYDEEYSESSANSKNQQPYSIFDFDSIYSTVRCSTRLTDNYGNRYSNALYNRIDNYHFNSCPIYEYILDQKFSRFSGTLYVPEGLTFQNQVSMLAYADDELIFTSEGMTSDSRPIDFDIDITGCTDLKLTFTEGAWWDSSTDSIVCVTKGFFIP